MKTQTKIVNGKAIYICFAIYVITNLVLSMRDAVKTANRRFLGITNILVNLCRQHKSNFSLQTCRQHFKDFNPLHSGNPKTINFANSEDPGEMKHTAAFHQGQHCLLR